MIVRRAADGTFVLIRQHDHGLLSGQFAQEWAWHGSPGAAACFAIAHHDIAWSGLDAQPRWNAETGVPYAFFDYPLAEKYVAYQVGIDLVQTASPYAGWLCSRHFGRFAAQLDDALSVSFVAAERTRQHRLHALVTPEERVVSEFDFDLLQLCDGLSLFVCLNDAGENTWPWYREGLRFWGERLMPKWDGPNHLRLDPDPLLHPVVARLPWYRVSADGSPAPEGANDGVFEIMIGG